MLALAESLGAARLATGHYARIAWDEHGPLIRAAVDSGKDQAYMLARLRPEALRRIWFPLGELTKPAVREIARAAGLPVAEKPESQDLCFLAGTRAPDFLARHGSVTDEPGEIVNETGEVVGHHAGQHRFTIGQRRGIGVAAPLPLYVTAKHGSTVEVGPKEALATTTVPLDDMTLYREASEVTHVKLRYRSEPTPCGLRAAGRHPTLRLGEPVAGAAPGQTACLMRGDTVIGCGTIAVPLRREVAHAG
jgi:tRNA-specific 2-thiouridylase